MDEEKQRSQGQRRTCETQSRVSIKCKTFQESIIEQESPFTGWLTSNTVRGIGCRSHAQQFSRLELQSHQRAYRHFTVPKCRYINFLLEKQSLSATIVAGKGPRPRRTEAGGARWFDIEINNEDPGPGFKPKDQPGDNRASKPIVPKQTYTIACMKV